MKYLIIIPDGAADQPQASLAGKTPLAAARKGFRAENIPAAGSAVRASFVNSRRV